MAATKGPKFSDLRTGQEFYFPANRDAFMARSGPYVKTSPRKYVNTEPNGPMRGLYEHTIGSNSATVDPGAILGASAVAALKRGVAETNKRSRPAKR